MVKQVPGGYFPPPVRVMASFPKEVQVGLMDVPMSQLFCQSGIWTYKYLCKLQKISPPTNTMFRDAYVEDYFQRINFNEDTLDHNLTPLKDNVVAAFNDVKKMDQPLPSCDMEALEASYIMACQDAKYMGYLPPMSLEQVLNKIDLTTSPGFPWNSLANNKLGVLSQKLWQEQFYKFLEFVDTCDIFECRNFTSIFLKEELRTKEKLALNKIRSICPSDLNSLILLDMCTMSFSEAMVNGINRYGEMNCVGINPFNLGWHNLYKCVSQHSKGAWGDVKQWDSSCSANLIEDNKELKFKYLYIDPKDRDIWRRRFNYAYYTIIYAMCVMPNGDVIMKFNSNSSGNGITSYLNTEIHKRIWFFIYYSVTKIMDVEVFYNDVCVKLYGDDLIYTTTQKHFLEALHPQRIGKFYEQMGFKMEMNNNWVDPIYLEFLNRSFYKIGSYVVFRMLNPKKAYASLLYMGKHKQPSYTIQRIQGLKISYFFYPEVYNFLVSCERDLIANYAPLWNNDSEWRKSVMTILSKEEIANLYVTLEARPIKYIPPLII